MYGDRRTSLMIMLVVVLIALAGVAYWKLVGKPKLGPYGAIAMSDTSLTYGGAWGYADPITATSAPSPNATRRPAATIAS